MTRSTTPKTYPFATYNRLIQQLETKTGRLVLNLGIGNPTFPPSSKLVSQLHHFIDLPGSHLYPGYQAIPELIQALIDRHQTRFGTSLKTNQVLLLNGAKEGIAHLPLALLQPGDEVLIPNPGYPAYTAPTLTAQAQPITYDLLPSHQFGLNLKEIMKKLTSKTRLVWLNFPSNPTGQVTTLEELKPLVKLARRHHLWLAYDNAYSEITFNGFIAPSILQIPQAQEIAIEFHSFSKSFSLAGYRLGWAAGSPQLISVLSQTKSQFDTGTPIFLQHLAARALHSFDFDWHRQMLDFYGHQTQTLIPLLKSLHLDFTKPRAGLYIWAKIPHQFPHSDAFSRHILNTRHIFLTPGSVFGSQGKHYVRVSISSDLSNLDHYLP